MISPSGLFLQGHGQDAKPVINSLADFPKDTTYWQYWANTGGENAANETEGGTLSIKVVQVKTLPTRTFLTQMVE